MLYLISVLFSATNECIENFRYELQHIYANNSSKTFFVKLFLLVLFLLLTSTKAISKTTPGIEYRRVTAENNQTIHVLDVDPELISINLVRAKDIGRSRETIIDIARNYDATAAINGGFFSVNENNEGLPAGLLKINDKLYGIAYRSRGAFGFDQQKDIMLMDRIQTTTTVNINGHELKVNSMNGPLSEYKSVLYSDNYNKKYLSFDSNSMHFIIKDNIITDIKLQHTIKIPRNGYVYSVGANLIDTLPEINIGDPAFINANLSPLLNSKNKELWNQLPNVISGAPLLIHNNLKITDFSSEHISNNFLTSPYARTAIGILKNKHLLLVVAEKDLNHGNFGLTISELTSVMQELGCTDALNLDGGGSSMMYYDNELVNNPDSCEDVSLQYSSIRKITDAIVLLEK